MKKVLLIIMAAVLLLSLTTVGVFAAKGEFSSFTDADNDGICDNRETRPVQSTICTGEGFVDADDNGICDNRETMPETNVNCKGDGFADADDDGICDNREDAPRCLENGICDGSGYNRNHCGNGKGLGCGKNR